MGAILHGDSKLFLLMITPYSMHSYSSYPFLIRALYNWAMHKACLLKAFLFIDFQSPRSMLRLITMGYNFLNMLYVYRIHAFLRILSVFRLFLFLDQDFTYVSKCRYALYSTPLLLQHVHGVLSVQLFWIHFSFHIFCHLS